MVTITGDDHARRVFPTSTEKSPGTIGMAFAVGAKAAKPSAQVICLHGDGSFGQNAMELDTAVRHKLPLLCVVSLNGGWTADPERNKPGRDLGYTRYDKMAEARGLLRRICRRARGRPPGFAACLAQGRGGHGRLCQRQDRLPPARRPCASPAAKPEPPIGGWGGAPLSAPFFPCRQGKAAKSPT
jgi:hypothetical protein